MKKYISAILILCLLLQLGGCYTQKVITLEELIAETDDEVVITLNNSDKYYLKNNVTSEEIIRNPEKIYCIDADATAENLILFQKVVSKKNNQPIALVIDTLEIIKNDVRSFQKNELNLTNTILLSCGIIIGIAIIVGAVLYEPVTVDLSGMKID